jgi:putative flippase GtrA
VWRRLFAFGLIGVVNTAIDWSVFWVIGTAVPGGAEFAGLAKAASYAAGVVASFFLNSRITFRRDYLAMTEGTRGAARVAFARFWAVALLCLGVNALTYETLRGTGYLDLPALVAATLAAFLVGFGLNQAWTFRSRA